MYLSIYLYLFVYIYLILTSPSIHIVDICNFKNNTEDIYSYLKVHEYISVCDLYLSIYLYFMLITMHLSIFTTTGNNTILFNTMEFY
jgi:hypothetical protein